MLTLLTDKVIYLNNLFSLSRYVNIDELSSSESMNSDHLNQALISATLPDFPNFEIVSTPEESTGFMDIKTEPQSDPLAQQTKQTSKTLRFCVPNGRTAHRFVIQMTSPIAAMLLQQITTHHQLV